jgi:hypothetical protein
VSSAENSDRTRLEFIGGDHVIVQGEASVVADDLVQARSAARYCELHAEPHGTPVLVNPEAVRMVHPAPSGKTVGFS